MELVVRAPVGLDAEHHPQPARPGGQPADWYFGVSNIDPESVKFNATVGGKPAVAAVLTMKPAEVTAAPKAKK